jgi:hypothetical protein
MSNTITTLETAMEVEIVSFSFTKLNKSTRLARGTRNLLLIPEDAHPKKVKTPPEDVLTFFDMDKKGWRSCRRDSIFGPWKVLDKDLEHRYKVYEDLGLE